MNCPGCEGLLVGGMCQTPACQDAGDPAPPPARKAVDLMAEHPSIGGRYRVEIDALKVTVAEQSAAFAEQSKIIKDLREMRTRSLKRIGEQGDTIAALRLQVADLQETDPDAASPARRPLAGK